MKKNNKVDKSEMKVYVTMHNNTRLMGSFYLEPGQRLQDLMNDERIFLPLHITVTGHAGKQYISMISKRYIEKVEELKSGTEAIVMEDDRRTGVDRRSPIVLQVDPIPSESEKEKNSETGKEG